MIEKYNRNYYFYFNEKGYGHWKHIKQVIKNTLDSPQISKEEKILTIISLLEDYRKRYLNDK